MDRVEDELEGEEEKYKAITEEREQRSLITKRRKHVKEEENQK